MANHSTLILHPVSRLLGCIGIALLLAACGTTPSGIESPGPKFVAVEELSSPPADGHPTAPPVAGESEPDPGTSAAETVTAGETEANVEPAEPEPVAESAASAAATPPEVAEPPAELIRPDPVPETESATTDAEPEAAGAGPATAYGPRPESKPAPVPDAPPPAILKQPGPQAQSEAAAAVAENEPPAPSLDMDTLGNRLRKTKAIGLFTKLELKSQLEDFIGELEAYHESRSKLNLEQLEEHFNLLVMKLIILLQDDDPKLHHDIVQARPALWTTLADPGKFYAIKGP